MGYEFAAILKTHADIDGEAIAWDVALNGQTLTVQRCEVIRPAAPTLNTITHAARQRLLPRGKRRAVTFAQSREHDIARPAAVAAGVDVDIVAPVVPVAREHALAEWQADEPRREAQRSAARHVGTTPGRLARFVSRIEDGYRDRTAVARFDELTEELADEFPGAGIDRADPDTLWNLMRGPLAKRPRAADAVALAVAMVSPRDWRAVDPHVLTVREPSADRAVEAEEPLPF